MMAAFLKTGSTDAEKNEDNNSIKSAVEATLSEIEKHGDAAVIELSKNLITGPLKRFVFPRRILTHVSRN